MSRIVYGIQPVREVLRAHGDRAEGLCLVRGDNPKLEGLSKLAAGRGVGVRWVDRGELDRRTKGGMHQGALVEAPELTVLDADQLFDRLESGTSPATWTILDGIMDPQNFGALIRSSVALADGLVVFPEHGAAPLTPATFRASAGAIEHATLVRVPSLPPLIHELAQRGMRSVLLEGSSDTLLESVDLTGPTAIIVGAEDRGARPAVRKAVWAKARVPMARTIDSLNASVATALALYEVGRQRRSASVGS